MKKLLLIIIIIAISIVVGYKSYEILNKPKQFENGKGQQFIKLDLMGEIESISESEIILKVLKLNIPNNVRDNSYNKDELETKYTGEKKIIKIYSDIKILKNTMLEKGFEQKEIDISNLKVGDVLNLTYKEDKSTIERIVLGEIKNNKIYNDN